MPVAGARFRLFAVLVLLVFHAAVAVSQTVVHEFEDSPGYPTGLLAASDGKLYVTASGGVFSTGTLVRIDPVSGQTTPVVNFHSGIGLRPIASPIDIDGQIYGTTMEGGLFGYGTVFRFDPATGDATAHSDFFGARNAYGRLLALDGALYGTLSTGGLYGAGTLYRINAGMHGVTTLVNLRPEDGAQPRAGLVVSGDALFGTTMAGGSSGGGSIIRYDLVTETLTPVVHFNGVNGKSPVAELEEAGGLLYGTTRYGGSFDQGTLFSFDPSTNVLTTLVEFNGSNGSEPAAALKSVGGSLYGTTAAGGSSGQGTLFRFDASSGTMSILHEFEGAEGQHSETALTTVDGIGGVLFGATLDGGPFLHGTVFRFDLASESLTTLASFPHAGGRGPVGLVKSGTVFYGTTQYGGTTGEGTVFRLDPDTGMVTIIASFDGASGRFPAAPVIELGGVLYGTTRAGGAHDFGVVFRLDPVSGSLTLLASFTGADGREPAARLFAHEGLLYGTTTFGGAFDEGTVFRIDPVTGVLNSLVDFEGLNGLQPCAGLTEAGGALFGTAPFGGAHGLGTVFRLDPATGAFSIVANFGDLVGTALIRGRRPMADLTLSGGMLYGSTSFGGTYDQGTLFRVDPADGEVKTVYDFGYVTDDHGVPQVALTESEGLLYGKTASGSPFTGGALFSFDPSSGELISHLLFFHSSTIGFDSALSVHEPQVFYATRSDRGALGGGSIVRIALPLDDFAITSPMSVVPGSTGNTAAAPAIPGVAYAWTLEGGTISEGQGTPVITFEAGAAGTTMLATVDSTGDFIATATKRISVDFADVPASHPMRESINTLVRNRVTAGCAPGLYCPETPVSRAQMAVLLMNASERVLVPHWMPREPTGRIFSDVAKTSFGAGWIEELRRQLITAGCAYGFFCPGARVTRAQIAVLLMKSHFPGYVPPPAEGMFVDLPLGDPLAPWVEDAVRRGAATACQSDPPMYCPHATLTRADLAIFLVRRFSLP